MSKVKTTLAAAASVGLLSVGLRAAPAGVEPKPPAEATPPAAAAPDDNGDQPKTTRRPPRKLIKFVPRVDSAPADLGTATARASTLESGLAVSVLAPQDHEGLTSLEAPSLFWFTTKPTGQKVEVALIKADDLQDVKPLLKLSFRDPLVSGIQRVNLADHDVKLQPGVKYKWSVSVVSPEGRSSDLVSQAIVRRVDTAGRAAPTGDDAERARLQAENGLWYDMLGTLSDAIDRAPSDATLRLQRVSVLEQLGLPILPPELKPKP